MATTKSLTIAPRNAVANPAGLRGLLSQIREEWQSKNLIKRVSRLLDVDASSACQRLLNASIHDLREKIHIAGLDIAMEAAKQNKLPTVATAEDIRQYTTTNILRLAYYMGLLAHPAWRRLLRAYDIRKDLEHEDDEYEASMADCLYVFQACIEDVLSQDPIQAIKLVDVKEFVEQAEPSMLTELALDEFEHAPGLRQQEIWKYLISVALDSKKPDIVRQNCYRALNGMRELVQRDVLIGTAKEFVKRIGRKEPSAVEFRIAYSAGVLPYLKKLRIKAFFESYAKKFRATPHHWANYGSHAPLLRDLEEIGGLKHCPPELLKGFVKWFILCYIGEPGGYGLGINRPVFYSNVGAPMCLQILQSSGIDVNLIEDLRQSDGSIKRACSNKHVARRMEAIIDSVGE